MEVIFLKDHENWKKGERVNLEHSLALQLLRDKVVKKHYSLMFRRMRKYGTC